MTTLYLRQDALGAAFADATWLLSEPFADRPTALDDYLRCSTLVRSCTPADCCGGACEPGVVVQGEVRLFQSLKVLHGQLD